MYIHVCRPLLTIHTVPFLSFHDLHMNAANVEPLPAVFVITAYHWAAIIRAPTIAKHFNLHCDEFPNSSIGKGSSFFFSKHYKYTLYGHFRHLDSKDGIQYKDSSLVYIKDPTQEYTIDKTYYFCP